MTLPGLLLLAVLTSCDAKIAANHHDAADCDDCNENGRWWPLFKPSQIIHSEFPEHAQHRSLEQGQYNLYENEAHYSSQERTHSGSQGGAQSGSQERIHPGSPERVHSGSQEQVYAGSHEQIHSAPQEQLPPYAVSDLGSREVAGIDSRVRSYSSNGKHRVEWDHYGDVSRVTTVAYNSLEARSGVASNSVGHVPLTPPNSLEQSRTSGESQSGSAQQEGAPNHEYREVPEKDSSFRSQEGSLFDGENYSEEKIASPSDSFPADFGISKEYPFSDETHESSNSIEFMNSHEGFSDFKSFKKPVATSYSAISSVFKARPILPQPRDLLHPDLTHNDVTNYIRNQIRNPVSHSEFHNRRNVTKQYLVHEDAVEDPGVLVINHGPIGRSHGPPSFIPLDHPVYRYVKNHGGLLHHYRRQPFSRASTLRWQDVHPELRNKFPFKHLQPRVRVQNHETMVHHVIPTKNPFGDSFWKESRTIENLKPPPLGQTLYFFKKKPNTIDLKKIRRRQSPNYMYIIKRNKRLS